MQGCGVFGGAGARFYKFLADSQIRRVWKLNVGHNGKVPPSAMICSRHFVDDCPTLLDPFLVLHIGDNVQQVITGEEYRWMNRASAQEVEVGDEFRSASIAVDAVVDVLPSRKRRQQRMDEQAAAEALVDLAQEFPRFGEASGLGVSLAEDMRESDAGKEFSR